MISCRDCRFWDEFGQLEDGTDVGQCRRNAPAAPVYVENEMPEAYPTAMWPLTYAFEWCGEWQAYNDCDGVDEKAVKQRQKELKSELKRAVLKNWSAFKVKETKE